MDPEIIPPGARPAPHSQPQSAYGASGGRRAAPRESQQIEDEQLDQLARLLDDLFQVPGTNLRVGLDAIVGLVPGIGDLLTSLAGFLFVFAGWQRGLPRVAIARMVANLAIDTVLGAIPFLGDLFDVAWKANRKNLALLKSYGSRPHRVQKTRDVLFLAALTLVLLALLAVPVAILVWGSRALFAPGG